MAGASTSQRTAAIPGKAPGAARLCKTKGREREDAPVEVLGLLAVGDRPCTPLQVQRRAAETGEKQVY